MRWVSTVQQTKLIEWRDEFSIGLPEVDSDHRELIESINRFHAALGQGIDAGQVGSVLGGIQSDIAAHFALEEKNMMARGYGQFAAHKLDHERLLDDILDIIDEVHACGRYEPDALATRLSEWFGIHFRTHDARLHHWLHGGA
jgi:hemerythrin